MTVPTLSVANYFIGKALETGEELTPMKLLKLVYLAHGWYLANYDKPLIGEAIEAWKYGPVVPSLYQQFKKYRNGPITQQAAIVEKNELFIPTIPAKEVELRRFLDKVWEAYSKFSGLELSAMTHKAGSPWYKTWIENGGSEIAGTSISQDVIKTHYKNLANRAGTAALR